MTSTPPTRIHTTTFVTGLVATLCTAYVLLAVHAVSTHSTAVHPIPSRDDVLPGRDDAFPSRDDAFPSRDDVLPSRDPGRDQGGSVQYGKRTTQSMAREPRHDLQKTSVQGADDSPITSTGPAAGILLAIAGCAVLAGARKRDQTHHGTGDLVAFVWFAIIASAHLTTQHVSTRDAAAVLLMIISAAAARRQTADWIIGASVGAACGCSPISCGALAWMMIAPATFPTRTRLLTSRDHKGAVPLGPYATPSHDRPDAPPPSDPGGPPPLDPGAPPPLNPGGPPPLEVGEPMKKRRWIRLATAALAAAASLGVWQWLVQTPPDPLYIPEHFVRVGPSYLWTLVAWWIDLVLPALVLAAIAIAQHFYHPDDDSESSNRLFPSHDRRHNQAVILWLTINVVISVMWPRILLSHGLLIVLPAFLLVALGWKVIQLTPVTRRHWMLSAFSIACRLLPWMLLWPAVRATTEAILAAWFLND